MILYGVLVEDVYYLTRGKPTNTHTRFQKTGQGNLTAKI